jgi:hypothetical protein
MLSIEDNIDLDCLRRWVHEWDPGVLDMRFRGMVEVGANATQQTKALSGMAESLIGHIQTFADSCTDAAECLFGIRSMASRVIYDSYFRADNGVMNVGNLYEHLLLPTDVATMKRLIKGFDYPDIGSVTITQDGEVVGEIGVKSNMFWHTFYDNYVLEKDETVSIEHVRDNHDHEFTLQVWKPGRVSNVAEFEHFADTVIFECADQFGLAFRRERFCNLNPGQGTAGLFNLAVSVSAHERVPLTHYAFAQSSSIPAHQFLGWYHVLEFFFSRARARLMHPRRNKIPELDMLMCVLENVIHWPYFFRWMNGDPARSRNFTSSQPVPFPSIDLSSTSRAIESTAKRIYSVRCEVVHSKEGESLVPPIIADALIEPELPLVRFLAGQAIRNGRQFQEPTGGPSEHLQL